MTAPVAVRPDDRPPRVVAHRGFAGRSPENTVAALSAAAPDCDAVEFDVRPTGDGDPVVVHDARLDDLTDAAGPVCETPTEAVVAAEVLGSGETVPRLAEVVDAVPADTALVVELKPPESTGPRPGGADRALGAGQRAAARERWQPFVDRVAELIAEGGHEVLYSSFREGALAAVRRRGDAAVAPLTATDGEWALDVAARHDAAAVHPAADLVLDGGTDLLARAHEVDVAVEAWTVRTRRRAERLREADVDGLIADAPGLVPSGR